MRRLVPTIALVLVAGGALAQEVKPSQEQKTTASQAATSREMAAVVIATDPIAKTITVKKDMDPMISGTEPEKTLSVDAKALATLKTVSVGEKVKLHVKSDATGKETVTTIEKSPTMPEKQ